MYKTLAAIFLVVVSMILLGSSMRAQNAAPAGNPAYGKIVFMKAGCYSCHGTVGQGGPAGPRLAPMKLSNQNFVNTVRNGKKDENQSIYWDGMPAYSARFVSDSELADISPISQAFPRRRP